MPADFDLGPPLTESAVRGFRVLTAEVEQTPVGRGCRRVASLGWMPSLG
jgi:hypothetical protein